MEGLGWQMVEEAEVKRIQSVEDGSRSHVCFANNKKERTSVWKE